MGLLDEVKSKINSVSEDINTLKNRVKSLQGEITSSVKKEIKSQVDSLKDDIYKLNAEAKKNQTDLIGKFGKFKENFDEISSPLLIELSEMTEKLDSLSEKIIEDVKKETITASEKIKSESLKAYFTMKEITENLIFELKNLINQMKESIKNLNPSTFMNQLKFWGYAVVGILFIILISVLWNSPFVAIIKSLF
ncbi:MAG: BdrC1 [candidate division WS6 bacterium GW2011_GWF1_35_23]|uniref:BdrC1 n=1 Tax=candidate division WS6 bacterium GW2011_GWF1_35_23 TaxID=1619097 RepID=A0A0G0CQ81_9BACT|nr:MAG: BdrC1 [candidate division WS6 bacterium GW2011_GWF1_35_23]